MKKTAIKKVLFPAAFCAVLLAGCGCEHEWTEATCTEPATCALCQETEGEALGHEWEDATCTSPKTCRRCDQTEGEALGHIWLDADCTTPKTCSVCGLTDGEALGHRVDAWEVTKEATCAQAGEQSGTCAVCGESMTEEIAPLEHTPGEWEIVTQATSTEEGERVKNCTVCGQEVERETYELSAEEKEAAFKNECASYSYNEIARNPSDYSMKQVKFRGEVIQVMEDGDEYALRVNVTQGRYYWDDTIYVTYTRRDDAEPRILEDDIITLYGYCMETITYETVMGASVTIPAVLALYVDIE